VLDSEVTKWTL